MNIIINMPDGCYEELNSGKFPIQNAYRLVAWIKNGIPLPKEYGRLFILDEAKAKKYFTSFSFSCQNWISEVGISNATLKVIEADKEEEND